MSNISINFVLVIHLLFYYDQILVHWKSQSSFLPEECLLTTTISYEFLETMRGMWKRVNIMIHARNAKKLL